jgi:hypothetical protein
MAHSRDLELLDSEKPAGREPGLGAKVRIRGRRGTWVVRGYGKDGSVTVCGGPCGAWRSVRAETLIPQKRRGAR